eukprot:scaffold1792_cov294-Pinguiococcus_pyrenoidosus.AAC.2
MFPPKAPKGFVRNALVSLRVRVVIFRLSPLTPTPIHAHRPPRTCVLQETVSAKDRGEARSRRDCCDFRRLKTGSEGRLPGIALLGHLAPRAGVSVSGPPLASGALATGEERHGGYKGLGELPKAPEVRRPPHRRPLHAVVQCDSGIPQGVCMVFLPKGTTLYPGARVS